MPDIAIITLGCPKNQVDSEELRACVARAGFGLTDSVEDADACIVNTCCFIDDAKMESIETVLHVAARRKKGARLIIMGCMGQRYRQELEREIPECDAVFGVDDFESVTAYLGKALGPGGDGSPNPPSAPGPYAYLKIADGCDRSCSFCVIPGIRGRFRSLDPDSLVERARRYIAAGAREIVLVAQDITGYGRDLRERVSLAELLRRMAAIEGDFWIRLLYLYPAGITDELLTTIAGEEKVCSYIDVPVQHIDDSMLDAMKRGYRGRDVRRLVSRIREMVPGAVIRTTLIVGFPGESEDMFSALRDFVAEAEFDRLGAFKYSPQEGTPAHDYGGQVPEDVKERRFHELMVMQAEISGRKNSELVGRSFRALVDEVHGDAGMARLYGHAPEIDGNVIIQACPEDRAGSFVEVRITGAGEYDLTGVLADEE